MVKWTKLTDFESLNLCRAKKILFSKINCWWIGKVTKGIFERSWSLQKEKPWMVTPAITEAMDRRVIRSIKFNRGMSSTKLTNPLMRHKRVRWDDIYIKIARNDGRESKNHDWRNWMKNEDWPSLKISKPGTRNGSPYSLKKINLTLMASIDINILEWP